MDDNARREIQTAVAQKLREKHMKKQENDAKSAVADGEKFLAANAKKDGVTTTSSGLQYRVLTAGTGAKPTADATVTVHYKGTLLNGDTFDSSYDRGEPATFKLNQVIPGWTEGVQLMGVGSKFEFVIPAALAYGEQGAGGKIGPNQVLKFDVELLEIKK
jgi:FKBP-type peptidyl-prolyl cis-trans isomerase